MQVARSVKLIVPRFYRSVTSAAIEAPAGSYLSADVVSSRVLDVMRSIKSCPHTVTLEQSFASDLQFDSMIRRELNNRLSDEFCIHLNSADSEKFVNGNSVVGFFSKHPKAR